MLFKRVLFASSAAFSLIAPNTQAGRNIAMTTARR